ncbi:MAG TPA: CAP domain-containing protein, partial [Acidimicrobiia bacterium]|nr:CAP domain-containing protein [Acidimicrobiia bacterium]
QRRADEMARSGRLAHTTALGTRLSGWKRLGENVGRGPDLRDIQTAFMNSPSHRQNIVDAGFSQLGVGATFDGKEYLYVAVIFREPSGAATAAAPTTTAPPRRATPTTRAAAAPKPKPTTTTRAPATTTTQPPSTTTTAPPPPPPVEQIAAPVEPPPAPPESTTTTTARPIFTDRDFLAQNFSDRIIPAVSTSPLPAPAGRSVVPIVVAAVLAATMGIAVGRAWSATGQRVAGRPGSGQPNQA